MLSLHEGNAVIEEDGEDVEAEEDLDIFQYNTVKTGKGKVAIGFIDDTRVDVTEHSKLIIDEFVYDPNTKKGSLSLKASSWHNKICIWSDCKDKPNRMFK